MTILPSRSQKNNIGPFLKWVGGKARLIQQFEIFLPETLLGRRYVEPFMGSAALFFRVRQFLDPASCTLLDVDQELVNAFQQIQTDVSSVIEHLDEHQARHNAPGITDEARKNYYYSVRSRKPQELSPPERAARFIYLNKTCYNGLYRLNSRGEFNVPIGRYALPTIYDPANLHGASALLQGVTIAACPFGEMERFIGPGDFVYLDPPYYPLSATSNFTGYSRNGFTSEDQQRLRDIVQDLSARCDCMLSNSTAPLIEELYAGPPFHKYYVEAGRMINTKVQGRGKIRELVVTTYPVQAAS